MSEFASRAAEKLRHGNQRAGALLVFAHSLPFRPGQRFNKSSTMQLHPPTSDTTALAGIRRIYESGYKLAKAGGMLLNLTSTTTQVQGDLLFDAPAAKRDHNKLWRPWTRSKSVTARQ